MVECTAALAAGSRAGTVCPRYCRHTDVPAALPSIRCLRACDRPHSLLTLPCTPAVRARQVMVYQLDAEGPADDDEGEDGTPSYREWVLPAAEFHGSWEALVRGAPPAGATWMRCGRAAGTAGGCCSGCACAGK